MDKDQRDKLNEPPPPEALKHRPQGSVSLTYIEGWWVIQQMNAIFGPEGWSREFVGEGLREASKAEITKDSKVRYDLAMLCTYRVTAFMAGAGRSVAIEDVGYGIGQSYQGYADAYESAAKEAVTDALKRCCRSLGNALGNCLYDKEWLKANAGKAPPKNDNQPPPASGGEYAF